MASITLYDLVKRNRFDPSALNRRDLEAQKPNAKRNGDAIEFFEEQGASKLLFGAMTKWTQRKVENLLLLHRSLLHLVVTASFVTFMRPAAFKAGFGCSSQGRDFRL